MQKSNNGFNPLNQVYVFNVNSHFVMDDVWCVGFNPLNQVYVFNKAVNDRVFFDYVCFVLIP